MTRQPIKSSNIKSAGYDGHLNLLEIEFLSGAIWSYANVPADKYQAFLAAPSQGAYFAKHIKYNYPATVVSK